MSSEVWELLAHPLRHRLLFEYHQPSSPSKVARRLAQRVNVVSYHTNVLYRYGWLELVGTGRRRGAIEHFYRSTRPALIEDEDWAAAPAGIRRSIILGTVAITRDQAHAAALDGGFDAATAHLSWSPLDLDELGVAEVAATLREVIDGLQSIAASSRGRSGAERHEVVIQFFRVAAED